MSKHGKLTVVFEPRTCEELTEWAVEDGNRSMASLLRWIVTKSLAERRALQHRQSGRAA